MMTLPFLHYARLELLLGLVLGSELDTAMSVACQFAGHFERFVAAVAPGIVAG